MTGYEKRNRIAWKDNCLIEGGRNIAVECPISISYGGSSHAVMMASPLNLREFAYGFSLTEKVIDGPDAIESIEIVELDAGFDIQVYLKPELQIMHNSRKRAMAGPVGCGLCGLESISEATRPLTPLRPDNYTITKHDVEIAITGLQKHQHLNDLTRAVHACGYYTVEQGIVAVMEDVGRHNALDKLVGYCHLNSVNGGLGAVITTSRLSLEMVQKTVILGCPIVIAVSAPTTLALDVAERAGLTVIAVARNADFEIFTHQKRIMF